MNNPIQLNQGDIIFCHLGGFTCKVKVKGWEVYDTVDSPVTIQLTKPNYPVYSCRIMIYLMEENHPVFPEGKTLCIYDKDVILKTP